MLTPNKYIKCLKTGRMTLKRGILALFSDMHTLNRFYIRIEKEI
ncbi:hypothetical protein C900_01577 [Fulvivirga imtechensis AK7]|uniref:Uncharacterized protein n=1 Tax=Fulvivirga imtechensis AK7 TaxID=1237149 RepID=L8JTU7_9BACT|nr:hypothetical protein C900_01577 [Fulvivirga imtechensis AK7]